MSKNYAPWAEGPTELLQHAINHLSPPNEASGFDKRIAMISIDNAVELMIKTFVGLPQRINGVRVPRNRREEAFRYFPTLLDLFEEFFPDRLNGIDLSEIEWYHRIRNQLYHDGNGMSVEFSVVETYFEIAKVLFSNLFQEELALSQPPAFNTKLGDFLGLWVSFDTELRRRLPPKDGPAFYWKMDYIKEVAPEMAEDFNKLLFFKNVALHAPDGTDEKELPKQYKILQKLYDIITKIEPRN